MEDSAVLTDVKVHRNNSFRKCELEVQNPRCRCDSSENFQKYLHFASTSLPANISRSARKLFCTQETGVGIGYSFKKIYELSLLIIGPQFFLNVFPQNLKG